MSKINLLCVSLSRPSHSWVTAQERRKPRALREGIENKHSYTYAREKDGHGHSGGGLMMPCVNSKGQLANLSGMVSGGRETIDEVFKVSRSLAF